MKESAARMALKRSNDIQELGAQVIAAPVKNLFPSIGRNTKTSKTEMVTVGLGS
jgi:hypothetical protein